MYCCFTSAPGSQAGGWGITFNIQTWRGIRLISNRVPCSVSEESSSYCQSSVLSHGTRISALCLTMLGCSYVTSELLPAPPCPHCSNGRKSCIFQGLVRGFCHHYSINMRSLAHKVPQSLSVLDSTEKRFLNYKGLTEV